ncbi:hypothetical protein BV22DRAFT_228837 [Leucogyrophana mollusca]|uniref:Uncharacterized protein n=1 Tax=Leucogyrophana mollusca TaxID=85980 RepID=A0ACB8BRP6_9AGAM|nr:hypothetical protein BV22DRAFT_228837 [Leucogyrophana mollusca]
MSTDIVLPTLTAFTESHLTTLLEATTTADFDAAFDAFFATPVNITVNGKHLSREQYKQQLLEQSAAGPEQRGASVTVNGGLEVEGTEGQLSGLVGIFYTALVDSKFLVLGAPAQSKVTSSLNVIIAPTQHNNQPPNTFHVTLPSIPTSNALSENVELGPGPVKLSAQQGPFGGHFGPGPVRLPGESIKFGPGPVKPPPQHSPFGGRFGPGPVRLPPTETGAKGETLPGDGEFGVGPVIIPGETIGDETNA